MSASKPATLIAALVLMTTTIIGCGTAAPTAPAPGSVAGPASVDREVGDLGAGSGGGGGDCPTFGEFAISAGGDSLNGTYSTDACVTTPLTFFAVPSTLSGSGRFTGAVLSVPLPPCCTNYFNPSHFSVIDGQYLAIRLAFSTLETVINTGFCEGGSGSGFCPRDVSYGRLFDSTANVIADSACTSGLRFEGTFVGTFEQLGRTTGRFTHCLVTP